MTSRNWTVSLVKCPKCDLWTERKPDAAWCPEHGAIPC